MRIRRKKTILEHAADYVDAAETARPTLQAKIEKLLQQLVETAKDEKQNIMPITIELVANGATMGDIIEKLKDLWGTYRENPVF